MWQVSCAFLRDCGDTAYSWSAGESLRDGTLFTEFLPGMNNDTSRDGSGTSCVGGHCDWRIPTVAELKTLHLPTAPGCADSIGPCIDPVFGRKPGIYWSTTSVDRQTGFAFVVDFSNLLNPIGFSQKNAEAALAMAVRGGR